jgi:hypothetical protein
MVKPNAVWFHTFGDNGEMCLQGRLVRRCGTSYAVQLFSWLTGAPGGIEPEKFTEEFLHSEKCKLYISEEAWRAAAARGDKRR